MSINASTILSLLGGQTGGSSASSLTSLIGGLIPTNKTITIDQTTRLDSTFAALRTTDKDVFEQKDLAALALDTLKTGNNTVAGTLAGLATLSEADFIKIAGADKKLSTTEFAALAARKSSAFEIKNEDITDAGASLRTSVSENDLRTIAGRTTSGGTDINQLLPLLLLLGGQGGAGGGGNSMQMILLLLLLQRGGLGGSSSSTTTG